MNKVNPLRIAKVKKNLLQGKSYRRAMLDSDYSNGKAIRGKAEPVIQLALRQIEAELKLTDITPESVIKGIKKTQLLAIKKRDYATALRADELLGKYLAMFTERETNLPDFKPINIINLPTVDNKENRITDENKCIPPVV